MIPEAQRGRKYGDVLIESDDEEEKRLKGKLQIEQDERKVEEMKWLYHRDELEEDSFTRDYFFPE